MKKGITIGIGLVVVIIAIFIGISSIPDDVLLESPSFGTSENQPAAEQPAAEQPAAEQPAAEQPAAEQPASETNASSTDNVIKVEIEDGVGSGDR